MNEKNQLLNDNTHGEQSWTRVVWYIFEKGLAADMHLHAQTPALPRVMSLAVFFILCYLLIIFCLNLSTFYNSSQVVKTRKNKLEYNVTCNRCLHIVLPATSFAFDTNRVRCQRRQDAVVVKQLKLI